MHPRPSRSRTLPLLLVILLSSLVGVVLLGPPAASAGEETPPASEGPDRLVLVLDSSGSMAEPAAGGGTKIQAAKDALGRVVEELPEEAEVGIRVFGAEVFDRGDPGACTDSRSVVPVGPLDRGALTDAVASYEPYGETPIGHALREAGKDLGPGSEGQARTIVLLSDGEPTCQPDPCKVAAQLADRGIDLTINVVGLDVSGKAREALRCVARAGNGDYYDASSADDLASSMIKVSVRPLRAFGLEGERVVGGTTTDEPLPLEPGTYVDTSLPEDGFRYYLVDRPAGGGVSASVLARAPKGEESWHTVVHLKLMMPDGADCDQEIAQNFQILGITPLSAAGIEHHALSGGYRHEECLASQTLLLGVRLDAEPTDFLLRVTSFPAFENAADLPAALESDDGDWVGQVQIPRAGDRAPVAGGVSFQDAPPLEPGVTYSDTLRPSEQLVYRVPAEYGQAVRVSARLGSDPVAADRLGIQGNPVQLGAHSALWQSLPVMSSTDGPRGQDFYNGEDPSLLTAVVPPLRLTNAGGPWQVRNATHGGDQFFVLGMGALDDDVDFAAPVTLRAELVGGAEGIPEYADGAAAPELAESPTDAQSAGTQEGAGDDDRGEGAGEDGGDGPGPLLWWVLGVAAVLLLVGAALALARRGRGDAS